MNQLTKLLEAAFYCASRPLTTTELKALDPSATKGAIQASIEELKRQYDEAGHGVELVQVGEGYQVLTRPEHAESIADAKISQRPRRLSIAAMETLAIIGYRQPVSRAEIEEIRGVAADGVLRSLVERGLIDVAGRGEGLGRPLLYGTTPLFLEMLGLSGLGELPRLDELSVALRPVIDHGFDEENRAETREAAEESESVGTQENVAEPVPDETPERKKEQTTPAAPVDELASDEVVGEETEAEQSAE